MPGAMPLSRLVLAARQFMRDEISEEIFRLALADFMPQLSVEGLQRLANQMSKMEPAGQ